MGKAAHSCISAFTITWFEAIPTSQQISSHKTPELNISMQLFLPRMTCLLYSSLDSRLLQQFVKEGTSEKDQLQGDSALQDTYKKKKSTSLSNRVTLSGRTISVYWALQLVLSFMWETWVTHLVGGIPVLLILQNFQHRPAETGRPHVCQSLDNQHSHRFLSHLLSLSTKFYQRFVKKKTHKTHTTTTIFSPEGFCSHRWTSFSWRPQLNGHLRNRNLGCLNKHCTHLTLFELSSKSEALL